MKTCWVFIYYCVLLVFYCPVCQVHGPILEMLVTSSLMPASFLKRKQFKQSRRTNSERENMKRSCFSKIMWKVLERAGKRTQISWPSDQRLTKLSPQVMHQNLQSQPSTWTWKAAIKAFQNKYLADNFHNALFWEHFDPLVGCQQSRCKLEFLIHSVMRDWVVWFSEDGLGCSVCMLGWLGLGVLDEGHTFTEGQHKERKSGIFSRYF